MYSLNAHNSLGSYHGLKAEKQQNMLLISNVPLYPNFERLLDTRSLREGFRSSQLYKKGISQRVNSQNASFNMPPDESQKIGFKRLNIINLLAKTNSNFYQDTQSKEGKSENDVLNSLEARSGMAESDVQNAERTGKNPSLTTSKSSYFFRYSRVNEYKKLGVELASPDKIRKWAERLLPTGRIVGLVLNANTLHHKTLKALKGGLFCERIFGPTKDFRCACGKTITKRTRMQNTTYSAGLINLLTPTSKPIKRFFCKICEVEYTWALTRRYQLGYISLAFPVTHLWYTKGFSSPISLLLDIHKYDLDSIIYCSQTTSLEKSYEITEMGISLKASQVLSFVRKNNNLTSESNTTLLQDVRNKNQALIQARLRKRKKAVEEGFLSNPALDIKSVQNVEKPKGLNNTRKETVDTLTKDICDFELLNQTLKETQRSIQQTSIPTYINDFCSSDKQSEFLPKSDSYLYLRTNQKGWSRSLGANQLPEKSRSEEKEPSVLLQSLILPLIVTYSTQFFAPFVFWLLSVEPMPKTIPQMSPNIVSTTLLQNIFTETFSSESGTQNELNTIAGITQILAQLKMIFTESLDTLEHLPDIIERQYHKALLDSRNKIQTLPVQTFGQINEYFYKQSYTVSIRQTKKLLKNLKSTGRPTLVGLSSDEYSLRSKPAPLLYSRVSKPNPPRVNSSDYVPLIRREVPLSSIRYANPLSSIRYAHPLPYDRVTKVSYSKGVKDQYDQVYRNQSSRMVADGKIQNKESMQNQSNASSVTEDRQTFEESNSTTQSSSLTKVSYFLKKLKELFAKPQNSIASEGINSNQTNIMGETASSSIHCVNHSSENSLRSEPASHSLRSSSDEYSLDSSASLQMSFRESASSRKLELLRTYNVQLNQLALHFFLYKVKKHQAVRGSSNNQRNVFELPYLKTKNSNDVHLLETNQASLLMKTSKITNKPTLSFYYNLYGIADDHLWDNINDWTLVKSYITIYPDVMDQVIPAYNHRIPSSSMTNFAKNQILQETTSLVQQYKKLPKKYVYGYLQPTVKSRIVNADASNPQHVKVLTNAVNIEKAFDLYEKSAKNQQALPIKSTGAGIINNLMNSITLVELQAMDKHFSFLLKESRKTILTYKTKIKPAGARYGLQPLPLGLTKVPRVNSSIHYVANPPRTSIRFAHPHLNKQVLPNPPFVNSNDTVPLPYGRVTKVPSILREVPLGVSKDPKEVRFAQFSSNKSIAENAIPSDPVNKQYLLYANTPLHGQTRYQARSNVRVLDTRRKTSPTSRSDRYAGIDKFMEKHHDLLRRAKVVRKFAMTNVLPKAMILKVLPVLPPDLRPIMKMADQIATSDLNRLYQRVLYRNERLNKIVLQLSESVPFGMTSGIFDLSMSTGNDISSNNLKSTDSRKKQLTDYEPRPTHELFETPLFGYEKHYAQRLLQEAVDNLIDNGRAGANTEKDAKGRALKSLSEVLKGKQGRFRQYLLGKRVDYSGRSVIVVGPKLKMHECGLPREMAVELYLPFIIQYLIQMKYTKTVVGAKTLIVREKELINSILENVVRGHPIILNRAPTLHRLGFQAFQPILVEGRAILLHPMACTAFNADFDGDQMAVHIPITIEARSEAWRLMLARNNLLSPATGEPIILPSQDMVLGCYYLTTTRKMKYEQLITSNQYFSDVETVLYLYYLGKLHLHTPIWVKTHKTVVTDSTKKPLEIRISVYGAIQEIYLNTEFYYDPQGNLVHQYIRTTPGRILFNLIIKNS
uniref:DNA-directed RNA polymerase subunit n=1 Tax=Hafniomonas laevis TaxID=436124 RepID=A0A0S2LPA6_9CHLO|nr:beta' subunit of RNA polymerase [Hafniomonas laevis]ALO63065.1 beta' subunit of RNA polymerase [Hafniomonas laevis]